MNNKQWLVSDFINTNVPVLLKPTFLSLMQEWDGSMNVLCSFYDQDVLVMKLKEAREMV